MKISDDTKNIVNYLNEALEGNLQKPADLEVLLEIGASYGLFEEFSEILFVATSLHNINRTIKRHPSEDFANLEKLEKEKISKFYELQDLIKSFIGEEDEVITDRFGKLYFGRSKGNLENVLDLCHDLSALNNLRKQSRDNQT